MKKVIITGATGFIGRQTIPILKKHGFNIHAITSREKTAGLRDDITWHAVNIFDHSKIRALFKSVKPSHLLHLAWLNSSKEQMTSSQNMAWLEASLHIIRQFAEYGGKKLVSAGSCAEYDWQYGYCSEQITPREPQSLYGECKDSLYRVAKKYCRQQGIQYSHGRIFFVYGSHESKDRLVPYVINSLLMDRPAALSYGKQKRDYSHVTDVADALVTLITSNIEGAVNIGSGQAIALRTIVSLIALRLGKPELISYGSREDSKDIQPVVFADITRLRDELGWTPKYSLEEGISATTDWWREKEMVTEEKIVQ